MSQSHNINYILDFFCQQERSNFNREERSKDIWKSIIDCQAKLNWGWVYVILIKYG